ncbi:DUF402 domain-containing protein [Agromyces protaetiae]|uniref:DUF402 domain-containing protein n=1 Tax=Agromyces protaetiae TaxID=2509455 RepID=A0A4P6F8W3_9MICO|nr:DUF402 domain-containing protein [Agromyces protaetiae]QAY72292.1 DUF402 domain-containing protein [Agromyces protaetiae]
MTDPAERPAEPGALVRVRYRKWDGTRHWHYDGVRLGRDEHGEWVGFPAGTHYDRPGWQFDSEWETVSLFPDAGWTPAFNLGHPRGTRVYVDLTTTPEWTADATGTTVSMIDLDLDVIERGDGSVYLDDEDEFAEHRAKFGYPDVVVERTEAHAAALLRAVERREPPFDEATPARWFAVLRALAG